MTDRISRIAGGPIEGRPYFQASAALGTTAVKITLPALSGAPRAWQLTISNPNATAMLAWTIVDVGAAVPAITADFSATSGGHVLPGRERTFSVPTTCDVYIVADAAASKFGVAALPF